MLAVQTPQTLSQNFSLGFPVIWLALLILVIWTPRATTTQTSRYWLSLACLASSVLLGLAATGHLQCLFREIELWILLSRLGFRAIGPAKYLANSGNVPPHFWFDENPKSDQCCP